jgi:hypothetical protein
VIGYQPGDFTGRLCIRNVGTEGQTGNQAKGDEKAGEQPHAAEISTRRRILRLVRLGCGLVLLFKELNHSYFPFKMCASAGIEQWTPLIIHFYYLSGVIFLIRPNSKLKHEVMARKKCGGQNKCN